MATNARRHQSTKPLQGDRLAHRAVEVLENGTYVGRARIGAEDQRGGSWYQSAYRAAVRAFGAGAYQLRPVVATTAAAHRQSSMKGHGANRAP